jgi:hypothetical protein
MKNANKTSEFALDNSQHYENRIPMGLWAEDDLPSEKMLMKGSGSLSDTELLGLIIYSGIFGENTLEIAKNRGGSQENLLNFPGAVRHYYHPRL